MKRIPEPVPTVKHFCKNCKKETDCEKIKWKGKTVFHCLDCLMNADYRLGERTAEKQRKQNTTKKYHQEQLFEAV